MRTTPLLLALAILATTLPADAHHDDWPDTLATAAEVAPGTYTGALAPGDEDWLLVKHPAGKAVRMILVAPANATVGIRALNASGESATVGYDERFQGGDRAHERHAVAPGGVYFRFWALERVAYVVTLEVVDVPDLAVTAFRVCEQDFVAGPAGKPCAMSIDVANLGGLGTPAFVQLHAWSSQRAPFAGNRFWMIPHLPPGGTQTISVDWDGVALGEVRFAAYISQPVFPPNKDVDLDRSNNRADVARAFALSGFGAGVILDA